MYYLKTNYRGSLKTIHSYAFTPHLILICISVYDWKKDGHNDRRQGRNIRKERLKK